MKERLKSDHICRAYRKNRIVFVQFYIEHVVVELETKADLSPVMTDRYGREKSVAVENRKHVCCSTYRNAPRRVSVTADERVKPVK